jgi:hypothetical protein
MYGFLKDLEIGSESSQCHYFKAKVLTYQVKEEINKTVFDSFDEKSIVLTDESTSYVTLKIMSNSILLKSSVTNLCLKRLNEEVSLMPVVNKKY